MTTLREGAADRRAAEVERQLELANRQLARFAEDLKRMVNAERERARALAEANARLARLDGMKTDFLNFIAHELRTPLTEFSALALIDPDGDPAAQGRVIEGLHDAYERLNGFVGRGLDYFNWAAGAHPSATVFDARRPVRAAADEHGLRAELPEMPCLVRASPMGLETVARVLVENARKHAPDDPAIAVHLERTAHEAILTVTDHGVGFPAELANELFVPFTIADTLHHARGTGLSLALARVILETYGGRVQAFSAGPGQGARFTAALSLVPEAP